MTTLVIILDTNVVSEFMLPAPDPRVRAWYAPQDVARVVMTVVTVMEVRHGFHRLPAGRRRDALLALFDDFRAMGVAAVLDLDEPAAAEAARFLADRERAGRRVQDVRDAQVVGIAVAQAERLGEPVVIATRNVADFEGIHSAGVSVANPWSL